MPHPVIVFDIETIPDYVAVARAHHLADDDVDGAKQALGDAFPKPPFHKVVVIAAIRAVYHDDRREWRVTDVIVHHAGTTTEPEMIAAFFNLLATNGSILVSYNGLGFDLPVLRYRAMKYNVSGQLPTRAREDYFARFGNAHWDLCDRLASYQTRNRLPLDAVCGALGLPGKTAGVDGSQVGVMIEDGRIAEVAAYCVDDVAATFRLFLSHEVFCNRVDADGFSRSLAGLDESVALTKGWLLNR